ncbi:MAG: hypothetical protein ABIT83_16125 [Massilia sp.]
MSAEPKPSTEQAGLASVEQIEALADQLSLCADELHTTIMRSIKAHKGGTISDAEQAVARALLEDEVMLRQRANGLYADAATYVVKALGKPQQHVLDLTAAAAEKIRKIAVIGDAVGLVAGLLALAGAAATGQAAAIIAALDKIRRQVIVLKADLPKPAAPAPAPAPAAAPVPPKPAA